MNISDYISSNFSNKHGGLDYIKPETAFSVLGIDNSKCVLKSKDGLCATGKVKDAIIDFIETKSGETTTNNILNKALKLTNCTDEICVIKQVLPHDKTAIPTTFKLKGPRDNVKRLSNYDIDGVLSQWCLKNDKFYNWGFNMIDFDKQGASLAKYNMVDILKGDAPLNLGKYGGIVKRPCNIAACIVNTDKYSGGGIHWFAVLCDCRSEPYTVEYFNSSGNPPREQIIDWMERTAKQLSTHTGKQVVQKTNVGSRHQYGNSECGLYSLFFIRHRLDGNPYDSFLEYAYKDDIMTEFRKYCFS